MCRLCSHHHRCRRRYHHHHRLLDLDRSLRRRRVLHLYRRWECPGEVGRKGKGREEEERGDELARRMGVNSHDLLEISSGSHVQLQDLKRVAASLAAAAKTLDLEASCFRRRRT